MCVHSDVAGGVTRGHGWDSDAGGKGQAMQSICCADAKAGTAARGDQMRLQLQLGSESTRL